MRFTSTAISDVRLIDLEPLVDKRGFFARSGCSAEFAVQGIESHIAQQNVSWNLHKGTLRGLHFQAEPHGEAKFVRVTQGAIFDVVVDIRRDSITFGHWISVELSAKNRRQIYIPPGLAHGFQTLQDDTEVFYQMTAPFNSAASRGLCWDDKSLNISWPYPDLAKLPGRMSQRDRTWPRLAELLGE